MLCKLNKATQKKEISFMIVTINMSNKATQRKKISFMIVIINGPYSERVFIDKSALLSLKCVYSMRKL